MSSVSRRSLRTAALVCSMVLLGGVAAGCGDEEPAPTTESSATPSDAASESPSGSASSGASESSESPGATESTAPDAIDITFSGDTVTPNGERLEAEVGTPITFHITAEEAGELHVHSSPEQELAYPAGESDVSLTIDQPGIVDVESHDLDQVVVQLEVR